MKQTALFAALIFWAARILAQEEPAQAEPPTKPQRVEGLVLIVKTGKSMGTAFRYQDKDGTFLISNLHVVAGPAPLEIYDTEGRKAEVGAFLEVAKDTDLVRIQQPDGGGLEAAAAPKLGEEVVSYGNSGGGNVITENRGKVLGVGPKTFEVSCEIVQGNSGGPIVNAEQKVMGVASFLTKQANDWNEDTRYNEVRRFGIRLDQPLTWEKVGLAELQKESTAFQAMIEAIVLIGNTMKGMNGTSSLLKASLPKELPNQLKAQRNFDQAVNYYNKNLITARNKQSAKLGFKQVFTHLNEALEALVEDQKPVFQSSWGVRQYEELAKRSQELSKKLLEQRDNILKTL